MMELLPAQTYPVDWGQTDHDRHPFLGLIPADDQRRYHGWRAFDIRGEKNFAAPLYQILPDHRSKTIVELEDQVLEQFTDETPMPCVDLRRLFGRECVVTILNRINLVARTIAMTTLRGFAKTAVISPFLRELLLPYGDLSTMSGQSPLMRVRGKLGDFRGDLYVHPDWDQEHPIVVAYKGSSEHDAGLYGVHLDGRFYAGQCETRDQSVPRPMVPWTAYYAGIRIIAD